MKKSLKILFPTEFSEPSLNAFSYALRLADRWNATIELLHVVYPQVGTMDLPMITTKATQDMVEVARELLKVFLQKGLEKTGNELSQMPAIVMDVEVGVPEGSILRVVDRDQIDLIIMGSRGENRSGIDKLMGSVAVGVVQNSPCPVMVIPEKSAFSEPLKVAYATDVKAGDPFEIWQSLKMLAVFDPQLHVVHINQEEAGNLEAWEKMEEMKEFLRGKDFTKEASFHHIFGNNLENSLAQFIEAEGINFLIMYQPSRNFWNRLFHKSQTKRMALHTKIPLMVQKD